jgi:hypothetical protein
MNPEIIAAFIGLMGACGIAALGFSISTAVKTGRLLQKVEELEKKFLPGGMVFGLHRRFDELAASADGTRDDLQRIRIELELNPYVKLRERTKS